MASTGGASSDRINGRHVIDRINDRWQRSLRVVGCSGEWRRTPDPCHGTRTDDGRRILCVLDATDHLDLYKARRVLGANDVRLLTEAALATLAPGCEIGAIPAVGPLFGLTTYADYSVRDDPAISFNAGSHRFSARVYRASWDRACGVVYGDLAAESDSRPAWARS